MVITARWENQGEAGAGDTQIGFIDGGFGSSRGTDMGYTHYWKRQHEIEARLFETIVLDFGRIILPLEGAGVPLAGFDGRELPEINDEAIIFNGIEDCGHTQNPNISIPFPSEEAGGIGSSLDAIASSNSLYVELKHRACNGVCRGDSFNLPRTVNRAYSAPDENGRYFCFCKTAFKPYDLAVQCALLICKHHLQEGIAVSSGGSADFHRNDARRFCFAHLGYPLHEFKVVKDIGLVPTGRAERNICSG